jgi:hypothetical protein
MLQIVGSPTDSSRGVIYNLKIFLMLDIRVKFQTSLNRFLVLSISFRLWENTLAY